MEFTVPCNFRSVLTEFGAVHLNELTLMFESSTLMLPPTANKASPSRTRLMSDSRTGPMNNEYVRRNTVPLHLLLCMLRVAVVMPQMCATRG